MGASLSVGRGNSRRDDEGRSWSLLAINMKHTPKWGGERRAWSVTLDRSYVDVGRRRNNTHAKIFHGMNQKKKINRSTRVRHQLPNTKHTIYRERPRFDRFDRPAPKLDAAKRAKHINLVSYVAFRIIASSKYPWICIKMYQNVKRLSTHRQYILLPKRENVCKKDKIIL